MRPLYSELMDTLWLAFFIFGNLIMLALWVIIRNLEHDLYGEDYCDHGPSEYDSYCPKCGLDS